MINVAIADDQILVRQGIASLLTLCADINVCWQADNGEDALQKIAAQPIDVVLMDIRMPLKSGIEALSELRDAGNDTKVIILTPSFLMGSLIKGDEKNKIIFSQFENGKVSKEIKFH